MANTTYEKGDVVLLKSGGPRMTVSIANQEDVPEDMALPAGIDPSRQMLCVWFVGEQLQSLWFDQALVSPSGPQPATT